MIEITKDWCLNMAKAEEAAGDPEIGAGSLKVNIDAFWQELVNKDDRTSPEEYPDHCLITFEELQDFVSRSRGTSPGNVVPSLQGPVSWRWRPRGATEWIYDPTEEWRKEHEGDIESEPLYAALSRS